ncbi:MAG: hypothetical protein Q8K76_06195 [Rhodoferax sp.]|nr:hypothetical protein [Rhodoferax sp.]
MVPLLMGNHWKKAGTVYPSDVRGELRLYDDVDVFSAFHPSNAECPPRVHLLHRVGSFHLGLDLSPSAAMVLADLLMQAADEAGPLLDKWTSIVQFEATPCTSL